MIKRKGFTLVEMLAVIVLIAVLSVVAVSTYRGISESSKQKSLEAKISQIETAAEKWARENNITNSTNISVNNLVVEGYLSADEAGTDGLAVIKNPVDGKNMICNTVDLSFKNGVVISKFNSSVYNCKLATQSLVDSNINIRVVSRSGTNLTGPGNSSIAKWTNEDVVIIVNSDKYDPKATSISYDFGGNTVTKNKDTLAKYSGTSFIDEVDTKLYYNVYYIESELLLNSKIIVTYAIPGEGTKSRAYTIRFDKEEATVSLKSNSEWITSNSKATITIDDGKGSGPAAIYYSRDTNINNATREIATPTVTLQGLDVGKYYIWTEDNAKNISHTYKMILEVNNVDKSIPACKVNFHGTLGDHGWYKGVGIEGIVTPGGETTEPAGISGNNVGVNMEEDNPVYTAFAQYGDTIEGLGEIREENTPKEGTMYYCHVKTLAGTYRNASARLYLDRTPPTLNITVDNPNTHEQHKTVHVRIHDSLSGLNESTTVQYGLSMSNTVEPTSWSNVVITTSAQNNAVVTKDFTTTETITGTWYLWIRANGFTDYAGNPITEVTVNGNTYSATGAPFRIPIDLYFDNTPPVCDGVGGKTNWTNTTYIVSQYCLDNNGTTDQSGCAARFFNAGYGPDKNVKTDTMVIRDNAGNTTVCPINVYQEHIKPRCNLYEPGPDGDDEWYKSSEVTITASFQDVPSPESGVKTYGLAKTPNPKNEQTQLSFSENGTALTAYCYVEDEAGNITTDSYTFKKDDGSEATNGGCSNFGNTSWTNAASVPVSARLNTPPISGCKPGGSGNEGIWGADCSWIGNWPIYQGESYDRWCKGGNCKMALQTNSGAIAYCTPFYHDIYSDRDDPKCEITKSHTETTDGVTFEVKCSGEEGNQLHGESGCVSSGDDQGTHTGVKSTTTYTVKDNAGNSTTCTGEVTEYDCNCDNCYTGSDSVCVPGPVNHVVYYQSSGVCANNCQGNCDVISSGRVACTWTTQSNCASYTSTCEYGCDKCYK